MDEHLSCRTLWCVKGQTKGLTCGTKKNNATVCLKIGGAQNYLIVSWEDDNDDDGKSLELG